MKNYYMHESSYIDDDVKIGEGTKIWYFCHVQSGARIGKKCTLGQNVNIGSDVIIGNGVKIQNNVNICEKVEIEDYAFCGPSCVFTNDLTPRAEFPKGRNGLEKTLVRRGASIGANATIICGNELGEYCFIGSGAVVTKDVKPHALMVGVPAKQIGWACKCGQVLPKDLVCVDCGRTYTVENEQLVRK